MKAIVFFLVAASLVGLSIWWEWSLWSECRADHSYFYCLRVLNK